MKIKNERILEVLKCALADLEGAKQCYEQQDIHAHDWKAHDESIDEVEELIADMEANKTGGE